MVFIYLFLLIFGLYGPRHVFGRGCNYDGKLYPDGADISRADNNCYGLVCMDGGVVAWDGKCNFMTPACPGGVNVFVEGQCCPNCVTSTFPFTPPTSTITTEMSTEAENTTTLLKGCKVKGHFYAYGTTIQNEDRCEKCICSSSRGFQCEPVACSGADGSVINLIGTRTRVFCYFEIYIALMYLIFLSCNI